MTSYFKRFVELEGSGGILLFGSLLLAIVAANTPLAHYYHLFIDTPIGVRVGQLEIDKSALLWINEGLMAVFFMLLSLEMKREILEGELSHVKQLVLPFVGAIGGIVFPALIYVLFNHADPSSLSGWPIPTTTDIAFSLGVVALLGPRVPVSLKAFLVALSIVDDILAVTIIAIFYTEKLSLLSLSMASVGLVALVVLNVRGVTRLAPYVLVGIFIWVCVLKSGVHATLGGAIVGLAIPNQAPHPGRRTLLHSVEQGLHSWVAYGILPLFVFANGGINFHEVSLASFFSNVSLGVALGLFLGKIIGVFCVATLLIKTKLVPMPSAANFGQLLGISALTGIGFTMSLFLTALAFYGTEYEILARQGVILGSLLSGTLGVCLFLRYGQRSQE